VTERKFNISIANFQSTTHTYFLDLKNKLGELMELNQLVTTYVRNLIKQTMYV